MLKDGDRFFFTHQDGPNAMGLHPQIQTMITKRTLADIICQNSDAIEQLPANVFRLNNGDLLPCDHPSRSQLDFEAIAAAISGKSSSATDATTNGYQVTSKDIYL